VSKSLPISFFPSHLVEVQFNKLIILCGKLFCMFIICCVIFFVYILGFIMTSRREFKPSIGIKYIKCEKCVILSIMHMIVKKGSVLSMFTRIKHMECQKLLPINQ